MEYRSVAELNERIVDWSATLPADLQLVVGIPRSGMLAANLLALHLHLPFTDLEGLCEGRILAAGQRGVAEPDTRRPLNVLVIDDSVCSGVSMNRARARIATAGLPHRIRYGAVFATPEAVREALVDTFAEAVPMPRAFEWNILNTPHLDRFCVDLDGVLRPPPLTAAPAGGLSRPEAAPAFRPRHRLGWLLSTRPESARAALADWLVGQGIAYRRLVLSGAVRSERQAVKFKARAYRASGADMFIEGDPGQAAAIAARARRPVFCASSRSMAYPGQFPRYRYVPARVPSRGEQAMRWLLRLPGRVARRLGRLARRIAAPLVRPHGGSPML